MLFSRKGSAEVSFTLSKLYVDFTLLTLFLYENIWAMGIVIDFHYVSLFSHPDFLNSDEKESLP